MNTVTLQEFQQNPAAVLDRVATGENITVVRAGRPVAEVRPIAAPLAEPRPFGLCAGMFTVPNDFDSPLPEEVLRGFEGR